MKRRIKLQAFLVFGAVAASILLPGIFFHRWRRERGDELLDAVGLAFILTGYLFRITARVHKQKQSHSGVRLVTDGPYAFIRHPMYFGSLLIGTGVIAALYELWIIPIFYAGCFAIYFPQIRKEEKRLQATFGDEYSDYCRRTPQYFPNFRVLSRAREYLSLETAWIRKEIISLSVCLGLVIGLETWNDVAASGLKEALTEPLELLLITAVLILIGLFLLRKRK